MPGWNGTVRLLEFDVDTDDPIEFKTDLFLKPHSVPLSRNESGREEVTMRFKFAKRRNY